MAECTNVGDGRLFLPHRRELLSGDCVTRAAVAEGSLEDRVPGSLVVDPGWCRRGCCPSPLQACLLPPPGGSYPCLPARGLQAQ